MSRIHSKKIIKVNQWLLLGFFLIMLFGPEVWGQSCIPGSRFIDVESGFPIDSLPFMGPNVHSFTISQPETCVKTMY
jgi:hypothetical protein